MKIVCDSCSTKYSISDDKVRGKVFKIRCKKCSHIIVVRGTAEAAAAAAPAPAAAAAPASADAVWHVVVDGDQVGPITDAEVRARLSRGEITPDTYIWREGFADWLKISATDFASSASADEGGAADAEQPPFDNERTVMQPSPDFAAGAAAAAAAAATPPPAADGGGDDPFAAAAQPARSQAAPAPQQQDEDDPFAAAAQKPASHDVFAAAAPAARRSSGADLFASPAPAAEPAPAARASSGGGGAGGAISVMNEPAGGLTGQRHENSVLFSLANLQNLAMPTGGGGSSSPRPGMAGGVAEGSGLIDIRSMAASTLGSSSSSSGIDDLPSFGTGFSPVANVLLPTESSSGMPKFLIPLVALMGVLLVGIGVMAYFLLKKPAQTVTVVEKVVAAPVPTTPPPVVPNIKPEDLPPREAPGAVAAATPPAKEDKGAGKASKGGKDAKGGKAGKGGDGKAAGGTAVAAAPTPTEAPKVAVKEEPKKPKSELDSLLDRAMGGSRGDAPAAPKPKTETVKPAAEAKTLGKSDVVAGMKAVQPRVKECYDQYKVPGVAMVNITIAASGKVSAASVTGGLAGTPTGSCVEKAVRTASFPPNTGLTTMYPFTLR